MLLVSKICSAILLAVLRLLAGLLPLKVHRKLEKWSSQGGGQNGSRRRDRVEIFLSMFLCFGAGLLLSTCFVHMIPEVRTSFVQASKVGDWPLLELYPFAEVVICIGFFAVYLLEEMGEKMIKHDPPEENAHEMERSKSQSLLGLEIDGHQRKNSNHHSHGDHAHAHGPALSAEEQKSVAAAIRGFLLVAALSFHSIFEGMAIGLQPTLSDVWFLFTAVIVHELAIMFCIGMEMLASKLRVLLYVIYMVELGLITSVGVGVGIVVTEYVHDPSATHLLVIAILQGIAAGTLLYVTFLEVLERERHKPGNGLAKLLAIAIGFFLLTVMETLTGQHDPVTTNSTALPMNSSIVLEEKPFDVSLILNATLS